MDMDNRVRSDWGSEGGGLGGGGQRWKNCDNNNRTTITYLMKKVKTRCKKCKKNIRYMKDRMRKSIIYLIRILKVENREYRKQYLKR